MPVSLAPTVARTQASSTSTEGVVAAAWAAGSEWIRRRTTTAGGRRPARPSATSVFTDRPTRLPTRAGARVSPLTTRRRGLLVGLDEVRVAALVAGPGAGLGEVGHRLELRQHRLVLVDAQDDEIAGVGAAPVRAGPRSARRARCRPGGSAHRSPSRSGRPRSTSAAVLAALAAAQPRVLADDRRRRSAAPRPRPARACRRRAGRPRSRSRRSATAGRARDDAFRLSPSRSTKSPSIRIAGALWQ